MILLGIRRHPTEQVANDIGVDIMKAEIPSGETFTTFLESTSIAFTTAEVQWLKQLALTEQAATEALFQLWALKEAYVKALGVGIGFDMSRISFDSQTSVLSVDGKILDRWSCHSFRIHSSIAGEDVPGYLGAVCYRLGEEEPGSSGTVTQLPYTEIRRQLSIIEPSVLLEQMQSLLSYVDGQ
ncbi:copper chaperone of lysine biosynthesis protein [Serendipita sp. 400]|nr:copper chaperone of lysine biosynthesis protein [Serendipita sp. 400]